VGEFGYEPLQGRFNLTPYGHQLGDEVIRECWGIRRIYPSYWREDRILRALRRREFVLLLLDLPCEGGALWQFAEAGYAARRQIEAVCRIEAPG